MQAARSSTHAQSRSFGMFEQCRTSHGFFACRSGFQAVQTASMGAGRPRLCATWSRSQAMKLISSAFVFWRVTRFFSILEFMGDTTRSGPNLSALFELAVGQHGYFTTVQAHASGIEDNLLAYHVRTGRFLRAHRGVYRLRDYPPFPHEDVVSAWLAVGKDVSVVSHESALDLLGLSDVIPTAIHFSVPRSRRNLPRLPRVTIHTTTRPFGPADLAVRDGIRLTSPARTIVDAAEAGTAPEQIELAIHQAIDRALTTASRLEQMAGDRNLRVRNLVHRALEPVIL